MKHIFKKNQIIITALAIMIAVAGYLNYSGNKLGEEMVQTTANKGDTAALSETDVAMDDSSLTDIASLDNDPSDPDSTSLALGEDDSASMDTASTDTASMDTASTDTAMLSEDSQDTASVDTASNDASAANIETAEGEITDTPGEAVLTSNATNSSGFAAEAKLSREQVRAKNKETLMEVINGDGISEEQKQGAIDNMTALTQVAEREAAAELMLDAKGFKNSVVSITDGKADVVIGMAELSDSQRAQIEDIVKRKTEVSGENIVITPMADTQEAPQK